MTTKKLQQKQIDHDAIYWDHDGFTTFENIRHLTLRVGKLVGKLSAYCEAKEQTKGALDDQIKNEVIPDLLSYALQLSNWLEEDLSKLYVKRIKENKKCFDAVRAKNKAFHDSLPDSVKEYGFDFYWDNAKVWRLKAPITLIAVADLEWHFDVPFLWEGEGKYNLCARDVLMHPKLHREEYDRVLAANSAHPIDVMENKGRLVILDGLHRLMKAHMNKQTHIQTRIIPRRFIPDIL